MEIITSENLNEIRKLAEKNKKEGKKNVVLGRDIEFNRVVLEMKNIDMLILDHKQEGDKLKQRNSGLNQVLCKFAKEKKIVFALDFSEITKSVGKEKAKIIGRLIQNIMLIKKYRNDFRIINKEGRDNLDLRAFLGVLGMPTDLAKKAVEN